MSGLPTPDSVRLPSAIQGCLEACSRCRALVDIVATRAAPAATPAYRSIGRHLRHCVDHFVCLLTGLDTGIVDYDARDRDARLEQDPSFFLKALASVVRRLEAIDPTTIHRRLTLRQESAPDSRSQMDTNVERELVFLSGHTIHHLAIMKLLAEGHGVELPEELFMAFSTANYLAGRASATPDLGHA